jgi:hypothetical protein
MEYFFLPQRAESWLNGPGLFGWVRPSLQAGIVWSASCLIGYTIIPLLMNRISVKSALSACGFSLRGSLNHLGTYLLLYALMVPFVYFASLQPPFIDTYPLIPEARRSLHAFLIWESAYVVQFFALESFFRGTLLFTLRKHVGDDWLAITLMVVPYTMIHFHKPALETFGALVAGLVLGWLSLRYKSWVGGAVLHSLVAVTMDVLSVRKTGLF